VLSVLRSRSDRPGALVSLVDGRYAVLGADVVAMGGRRALAAWCERRSERGAERPADRAWWQEVTGALLARG
jgi:hypothetical protein